MAAGQDSGIGSILLWAGVAYAAYLAYQASQSASSGSSAANATPGQFSTSGVTAGSTTAALSGSQQASQQAGGVNPGMLSASDMSWRTASSSPSGGFSSSVIPSWQPATQPNPTPTVQNSAYYNQVAASQAQAALYKPDASAAVQLAAQTLAQEQAIQPQAPPAAPTKCQYYTIEGNWVSYPTPYFTGNC